MSLLRQTTLPLLLTVLTVCCALAQGSPPPASVHPSPYSDYYGGLHVEINPANSSFYSVYNKNRIGWAFQKLKNDEHTLLIEYDEDDGYTDEEARERFKTLSPVVDKDSKVRNVYIRNKLRRDVYVQDSE